MSLADRILAYLFFFCMLGVILTLFIYFSLILSQQNISGDEPKEEVSDDLFQNVIAQFKIVFIVALTKFNYLIQIWNSVYQLGDPRQPPKTELWNKTLDLWQKCMYPSHLHDCHSLIEEQKKLETIYSNGTLPSWAVAGNAPWVLNICQFCYPLDFFLR